MNKPEKQDAWKIWTSSLTESTRSILQCDNVITSSQESCEEEVNAYNTFYTTLSNNTQSILSKLLELKEQENNKLENLLPKYGLVECQDGEWGTMRLYKNYEGLAKRVGQLEGTDTIVWCFFGTPVQLSKVTKGYRYLLISDKAIQVPLISGEKCKLININELTNLEIQDDGYIGPMELANPQILEDKLNPVKQELIDNTNSAEEAGID